MGRPWREVVVMQKQIPVKVRATTNPEDRVLLEGEALRVRFDADGLHFQNDTGSITRSFPWPDVSGMAACTCERCLIVFIRDKRGVYENFDYELEFTDNYYKEAFVKWAAKYKPTAPQPPPQ